MKPLQPKAGTSSLKRRQNVNSTKKKASGKMKKASHSRLERIIEAKEVGWVNNPVTFGKLLKVIDEPNRVIFEFQDGTKQYDAWSSKNGEGKWGLKNIAILKPGYQYVLQGTIKIETKSTKYFRSTNSNFRYEVFLGEISIVEKIIITETSTVRKPEPLQEMKEKVKENKSGNVNVKDVKVVSGNLRRYMGCELCFAGLSKPGLDGRFHCKICKKKFKHRTVCVMIKNLQLEDNKGNQQDNILCYHKECEIIFGSKVFQRVCKEPSDLKARKMLSKIVGTTIESAKLKNQQPTKSKKSLYNEWKLIIANIVVKEQENVYDDGETDEPARTSPVSSTTGSNLCPCVFDEDDDDDNDDSMVTSSTMTPEPGASTSNKRNFFINGSDDLYDIREASDGFIGLALLINISFVPEKKYPGPCQSERKGSKNDVTTLANLLPEIGIRLFKDTPFHDVNLKEFQNLMKQFKEELKEKDYSCMFFIIMSHGSFFHVRLRDLNCINVYSDVLSEFSDEHFGEFCGKPKVCILNSCQYFYSTDANFLVGKKVDQRLLYPDMLICTPCSYGYGAKRHRKKGSYFIQEFAKVLRKNWEHKDILAIMDEVQTKMSKMLFGPKENKVFRNVPEYKPMLFGSKFYFKNPASSNATEDMEQV